MTSATTPGQTIPGTTSIKDIDTVSYQNIVDPLDRTLKNYRRGCQGVPNSVAQITVNLGEVWVSNAAGTIRLALANSSNTTVTWASIDSGAEANSTTYYFYAYTNSITAENFSVIISTNATTPTGATYYRRLGSFYNNASGNIESIVNDDPIVFDVYDSGWFAGATTGTYAKTHGLGTNKLLIKTYYSAAASGTNAEEIQAQNGYNNYYGTQVTTITTTALTVQASADAIATTIGADGNGTTHTSGYLRVIAMALE